MTLRKEGSYAYTMKLGVMNLHVSGVMIRQHRPTVRTEMSRHDGKVSTVCTFRQGITTLVF